MELYEILVPTMSNQGRPYRTKFHRVWDAKVYQITGGLTILAPSKGKWISPISGGLFQERMIPVRIACSRNQIEAIIQMTIAYYNQEAVMAYKISDEVLLKYKN